MSDISQGQVIGPCRIIEAIGEGGMGSVYKAEHPKLGKMATLSTSPR